MDLESEEYSMPKKKSAYPPDTISLMVFIALILLTGAVWYTNNEVTKLNERITLVEAAAIFCIPDTEPLECFPVNQAVYGTVSVLDNHEQRLQAIENLIVQAQQEQQG